MSAVATDAATISYNGYAFNSTAKAKANVEFIPDDAGRTILYQRITLTVRTIIADDDGTDGALDQIKAKLSKQGGALRFVGQGFGDLSVNVSNTNKDVKFGPVPTILSWLPIGSLRACEVEWQIVAHVSPCSRFKGLMSLNHTIDWNLDSSGLTRRTIAGHLIIAQTREGNHAPDTADAYRHLINPQLPLGYRRETQNYSLSADKSRLDFTINDSQIDSPNPYPEDVEDIDDDHEMEWQKGKAQHRHRISMTIKTKVGVPTRRAFEVFQMIADARLRQAKQSYRSRTLLESVRLRGSIYNRQSSFSIGYRIIKKIVDLQPSGGLWTPIEGDWGKWRTSMATAHSNRGHSGLAHFANEDTIVDLCSTGSIDSKTRSGPPIAIPSILAPTFQNEKPPANESWLRYHNEISIRRKQPSVMQYTLGEPDSPGRATEVNATTPTSYDSSYGESQIIQQTGPATYIAIMTGYAERVGYPIPMPVLEKIGDSPAVLIKDMFDQRSPTADLGVPVFQARWRLTYALSKAPGVVKPPANPLEGTDGSGNLTS